MVIESELDKRIRLPFSAMINLWYVDEAICRVLTDCGWGLAYFGIECGDELYRKTYLNRPISNAMIEEKVALLKKYKIRIVTSNMIGMPFEMEINRGIFGTSFPINFLSSFRVHEREPAFFSPGLPYIGRIFHLPDMCSRNPLAGKCPTPRYKRGKGAR